MFITHSLILSQETTVKELEEDNKAMWKEWLLIYRSLSVMLCMSPLEHYSPVLMICDSQFIYN